MNDLRQGFYRSASTSRLYYLQVDAATGSTSWYEVIRVGTVYNFTQVDVEDLPPDVEYVGPGGSTSNPFAVAGAVIAALAAILFGRWIGGKRKRGG